MDLLVRVWREEEMNGCIEGDKMSLMDRINGKEEEEENETVMVAERWDYVQWVQGVWLEKLNIGMIPNKL